MRRWVSRAKGSRVFRAVLPIFLAVCLTGDEARDALLQAANTMPAATPFQTAFWLDHWYANFCGADRMPLVICVQRQGDHGSRASCCRWFCTAQGMQRIIAYADWGVTDYNAPLMAASFFCPAR